MYSTFSEEMVDNSVLSDVDEDPETLRQAALKDLRGKKILIVIILKLA